MNSQPNDKRDHGQLFVVATPIGNLADITFRAVETLKSVDLIAAEDTRVSRRLLSRHGIETPLVSCHEHNEEAMTRQLLMHLENGRDIALISDAGTPLINDPGYRLIRFLRERGIRVSPIPGASSPIAALSAGGLPSDRFTYEGFLARSGKARKKRLQALARADCTSIILESPRRLEKTLEELIAVCGETRMACVAREITKLHENFVYGSLREVAEAMRSSPIKGEIVLLVGPAEGADETDDDTIRARIAEYADANLPPSTLAKTIAAELDVPRARVYPLLLDRA